MVDRLDPIGGLKEDIRIAYICTIMTNLVISVHGKKGSSFKNITDFLLKWDVTDMEKGVKVQTPEEMKTILLGIAKSQNKRQLDLKKPPRNIAKTEKK